MTKKQNESHKEYWRRQKDNFITKYGEEAWKTRSREINKRWREKHREEIRIKHKIWNDAHPDRYKDIHEKNRRKIRLEVLVHYSQNPPKCACCGEIHIEFLSIDHINNDGAEHRKKIGKGELYSWLKKNKYPEGFQVLCMNCNISKGHYGYCPHQKETEGKNNE